MGKTWGLCGCSLVRTSETAVKNGDTDNGHAVGSLGRPSHSATFSHAGVADVVYAALSPGRRNRKPRTVPPTIVGQIVHIVRKVGIEVPAPGLHPPGGFSCHAVICTQPGAIDHQPLQTGRGRQDFSMPQVPSQRFDRTFEQHWNTGEAPDARPCRGCRGRRLCAALRHAARTGGRRGAADGHPGTGRTVSGWYSPVPGHGRAAGYGRKCGCHGLRFRRPLRAIHELVGPTAGRGRFHIVPMYGRGCQHGCGSHRGSDGRASGLRVLFHLRMCPVACRAPRDLACCGPDAHR